MTAGPAQRRSHVRRLANDNQISTRYHESWASACAYPELRECVIPDPADSPVAYLLALHELGHVLQPWSLDLESDDPQFRGPEGSQFAHLARESLAWAWAASRALPVPQGAWDEALAVSLVAHFRKSLVLAGSVVPAPAVPVPTSLPADG